MPRRPRIATGGLLFHVLNRAAGRMRIFHKPADYAAFERIIQEIHARLGTRILDYVLMPNHFHLALWPREDDELSEFMRLLTVTHTQRWHAHRHSAGTGPVYQGRFKSFPVQRNEHLLTVLRYMERNPLRAALVKRAELWQWGAAWKRIHEPDLPWLMKPGDWPIDVPRHWLKFVNQAQTLAEEQAIVESIRRGRPLGEPRWQKSIARQLQLESSFRPRGRPRLKE